MGKMNQSEIDQLVESGEMSQATADILISKGMVTKRRMSLKKYLFTEQGTPVVPELCFKGIGKESYTKEMDLLKSEVFNVINKYTKELPSEERNAKSVN